MTTRARASASKDGLQDTRIDLAAAPRLIHLLGLDGGIHNQLSIRLPGAHDRFLINPSGMRFEEVTASNLVTVDIDGNIVEDPLGLGINPLGFTINSAIHSPREDAICVLHTHAMAGVAVSALFSRSEHENSCRTPSPRHQKQAISSGPPWRVTDFKSQAWRSVDLRNPLQQVECGHEHPEKEDLKIRSCTQK
ncbi:ribulose-5-phosphate 4-epimerase/fuculose-1-phosphate aldolase [Bradyrhizobium sp. i1.3.1]